MVTPCAIVTGGSSGIGASTAKVLSESGYDVTLIGRDKRRLVKVAASLDRCRWQIADVAESAEITIAVSEAAENAGRLDLLVNAAGVLGPSKPIWDLELSDWDCVMRTNLYGTISSTAAAIPFLKSTQGSVVNVGSINSVQAESGIGPYGVSKSAVVGFTKFAAADLATLGIRVNAVLPGWVSTDMISKDIKFLGIDEGKVSTNLVGRVADPSEIAHVIAFLGSPKASYLTGSCVVVDGGQIMFARDLAPAEDV